MEALAAYGSASEDEPDEPDPPAKRSRPAPLPPPPLDGDADDTADAALVRQFPHVDGNFAAHVFLTVAPAPALQQAIDRAVAALGVHRLAEYHVSLSRTFVLRRPQIAPFGEALRKAAAEGDLARCRALLRSGASPHSCDEAFERTALHYAAQHDRADAIALLLSARASVDARDLCSFTPLHLAAERGSDAAALQLLRFGEL